MDLEIEMHELNGQPTLAFFTTRAHPLQRFCSLWQTIASIASFSMQTSAL
jgi:hypothetical protein